MGSSPSSANLYFDAWRIPKHRIFASLVLIPRTFGTIGTLERLEPALVFNGLNVLNGLHIDYPLSVCLYPFILRPCPKPAESSRLRQKFGQILMPSWMI